MLGQHRQPVDEQPSQADLGSHPFHGLVELVGVAQAVLNVQVSRSCRIARSLPCTANQRSESVIRPAAEVLLLDVADLQRTGATPAMRDFDAWPSAVNAVTAVEPASNESIRLLISADDDPKPEAVRSTWLYSVTVQLPGRSG